jgi:hypothetical protein
MLLLAGRKFNLQPKFLACVIVVVLIIRILHINHFQKKVYNYIMN